MNQPQPTPEDSSTDSAPETFDQLLAQEQEFLRLLIRTIGVSPSDANDVLQEANIYLINNATQFELGTNFRAWASKVVRYRCLQYFRDQKRRPMINLSEQAIDLITEEVCEQYEETERQLRKLNLCIDKLPADHADMLKANYHDGMTLKDYAKIHKKSHMAVRKTMSRVRHALKDCIEKL
ncbi:hypothetical protein Rhal01_00625 [Rubritalea halochordaticola]|uniref:RNA polymerase sigma-70 region 2 domain-containing protein n=1 Tax=Rubritalea halochordaticola TaxID=714537 RepID=A0ABP9UYM7_9BACT